MKVESYFTYVKFYLKNYSEESQSWLTKVKSDIATTENVEPLIKRVEVATGKKKIVAKGGQKPPI